TANKTSQATAVFALLLVLNPVPAAPEFFRSSRTWQLSHFNNPQGWQTVAGGRSIAETSGMAVIGFGILEGCQRSATPAGSMGDCGRRSGGIAALNPRLISGKPMACFRSDDKTNQAASVDAPITCLFAFEYQWRRATEQQR